MVFKSAFFLLAIAVHQPSMSEDLFSSSVDNEFNSSASISSQTTIGGYPLYIGGRHWRILNGRSFKNNINHPIGEVRLISPKDGKFFAQINYTVSLAQGRSHFVAEPCKGNHLAKNNNGGGYHDDCMTINMDQGMISGKNTVMFKIHVTNSHNDSRLYDMFIYFNLEHFGFNDPSIHDWTEELVARNPTKKKAIDKLSIWAIQLQKGVAKAIGFQKPSDAFDGVPPIDDLLQDVVKEDIKPVVSMPTPSPSPQVATVPEPASAAPAPQPSSLMLRLTELKALLDKGLISKEQYEQRSSEMIKEF